MEKAYISGQKTFFLPEENNLEGMSDMKKKLQFGKKTLFTDNAAFIMGIVNCTPDSFYSGSRGNFQECVSRAFQLIEEGADILDLGGESTRPGSSYVSEKEEIERIIPVLKEIRKKSDIAVSIDTRKSAVMKAAFDSGADLLNDVSALEDDPGMADLIAENEAGVILMHKKGTPVDMQKNISYTNLFDEVEDYLEKRAAYAESKGISSEKIILDPGIGFSKNLEQNKILTAKAGTLCGKKYPVLMALSRKSYLGEITGRPAEERLEETLTADLIAVMKGADIVRVHDVLPCRESLMVLKSFIDSGLI